MSHAQTSQEPPIPLSDKSCQTTGISPTNKLTAAWNQTHVQDVDAWNQQVQVDLAEQEEATRLAEEEEARQTQERGGKERTGEEAAENQ